jgi:hypothetical protein
MVNEDGGTKDIASWQENAVGLAAEFGHIVLDQFSD